MDLELMPDSLKRIFALGAAARSSKNKPVLIDGRIVLMTKSQARRYRELRQGSRAAAEQRVNSKQTT